MGSLGVQTGHSLGKLELGEPHPRFDARLSASGNCSVLNRGPCVFILHWEIMQIM